MSDANKAVFLSYASQDADAARRICDALRSSGIEVWFDQNELVGGDAWDAKIRKQIKDCALFVPIISSNTQARTEGYFRLEWRLADQRTHLMAKGRAFLLPVVIDATRDAEAHVPDSFLEVQWTRLPTGEGVAAFAERTRKLLSVESAGTTATAGRSEPTVPRAAGRGPTGSRRWMYLGLATAVVGVAVWLGFNRFAMRAGNPPATAPLSEARQLVERARSIYETGDQINRETYALAEALLVKAEELDVTDAEAWALHATISRALINFGFDVSPARHELARSQAERALKLAPESPAAQLAYAGMQTGLSLNPLAFVGRSGGAGPNQTEGEQILRRLIERQPDNWRASVVLATALNRTDRRAEAIEVLRGARQPSLDHPAVIGDLVTLLTGGRRFAEAEQLVADSLARQPSGRVLEFGAKLKLIWRGDPAAATAALDRWPAWMFNEDRGAHAAAEILMFNREPTKALAILGRFSRDYIRHARFLGPRAALTAWLHEQAGNPQAARSDWRTTLEVVERELATSPGSVHALHWKAWALARLGEKAAAEPIFAELLERRDPSLALNVSTGGLAGLALALDKPEAALAELAALAGSSGAARGAWITRAVLELNPCFDPLRTDRRFAELVATATSPGSAPAAQPPPDFAAAKSEAKSVVVLPFANLSGDPEQEYFSDGLTEEILNALARERDLRVPGRASAFSFKGKGASAAEIAKALNVAQLVEGSVRKAGNRVRISVQLTRASDGFSEALPTVERELTDIFALQDEVAKLVVEKLTRRATTVAPVAVLTKVPEAYDAYLRGRVLQARSGRLALQAAAQFERAVQFDPAFALAWARMAETRLRLYTSQYLRSAELANGARVAYEKALEQQPDLPEGLIARARWNHVVKGDRAAAERDLAEAAKLQAPTADLRLAQASLAWDSGARAQALAAFREAVALDPGNGDLLNVVALRFQSANEVREADHFFLRAIQAQGLEFPVPSGNRLLLRMQWRGLEAGLRLLERGPTAPEVADLLRADILLQLGRTPEARTILSRYAELPRLDGDALIMAQTSRSIRRIRLFGAAGQTELARRHAVELRRIALEELAQGNRADNVWVAVVVCQTLLGEREAALAALAEWKVDGSQAGDAVHGGRGAQFMRLASGLYAQLGRPEDEIALLRERVLHGIRWGFSLRTMREMEPLRDDPRFQEIVRDEEAWARALPDPIDP